MWPVLVAAALLALAAGGKADRRPKRTSTAEDDDSELPEIIPPSPAPPFPASPEQPAHERAFAVGDQFMTLFVYANELEVFTPHVLQKGRRYEIEVAGVFSFRDGSRVIWSDGFYQRDHNGNFLVPTERLRLNNKKIDAEIVDRDRALHRYVFHLNGMGNRLSIRLKLPWRVEAIPNEGLHVTVKALKVLEPKPAPAPRVIEVVRWRPAPSSRPATREYISGERAWHQKLDELTVEYQEFPHYEDPTFVEREATVNAQSLIARREEIMKKYRTLHQNLRFIQFLKGQAPGIYSRATWEVRALARAEQLAHQPVRVAKKKKEKDEAAAGFARRAKTLIAIGRKKAEATIAAREALDRYVELDPDERQRIATDVTNQFDARERTDNDREKL